MKKNSGAKCLWTTMNSKIGLRIWDYYIDDKQMNLCSPQAGKNWGCWKCSRCKKMKGYLRETFFAGTHLSLKEVFRLSFYCCYQQYTVELIRFNFE